MSGAKLPTVSIGMPIYNAETRIETTLITLLQQDFDDFELIISDNCSTDATWNICQEFAQRDHRIRLHRNTRNIGAIANFNQVFGFATGKYFMWAAHDDYWEPTYLSDCVTKLESNPHAVLCYTEYIIRHENRGTHEHIRVNQEELSGFEAWRRVDSLLGCRPFPAHIIYGVFRRESLAQALPLENTLGSDTFVLLRAAATGPFVRVDKPLFIYINSPRTLKIRAKSFAEQTNLFTLLRWDIKLFWIPLTISQRAAPNLKVRWLLFRRVLRFYSDASGGLSPRRLLNRYLAFVLPDQVVSALVKWFRSVRDQ